MLQAQEKQKLSYLRHEEMASKTLRLSALQVGDDGSPPDKGAAMHDTSELASSSTTAHCARCQRSCNDTPWSPEVRKIGQ